MTQQERLDKFKTLYKPIVGHSILTGISDEGHLVGVVYKNVEIVSKRYGKEIAETHIFYSKVKDMLQFIKELEPYMEQRTKQLV